MVQTGFVGQAAWYGIRAGARAGLLDETEWTEVGWIGAAKETLPDAQLGKRRQHNSEHRPRHTRSDSNPSECPPTMSTASTIPTHDRTSSTQQWPSPPLPPAPRPLAVCCSSQRVSRKDIAPPASGTRRSRFARFQPPLAYAWTHYPTAHRLQSYFAIPVHLRSTLLGVFVLQALRDASETHRCWFITTQGCTGTSRRTWALRLMWIVDRLVLAMSSI